MEGDRRLDVTKDRKFEERHKLLITVFIGLIGTAGGWIWSAGHKDQQLQEAYTYIKAATDIPVKVEGMEEDLSTLKKNSMSREVIESRFSSQSMQINNVEKTTKGMESTLNRNATTISLMRTEVLDMSKIQSEILLELKRRRGNTAHGG